MGIGVPIVLDSRDERALAQPTTHLHDDACGVQEQRRSAEIGRGIQRMSSARHLFALLDRSSVLASAVPARSSATSVLVLTKMLYGLVRLLGRGPCSVCPANKRSGLLGRRSKAPAETPTSIPGIGTATATVVLVFHDPTNYAVGNRYTGCSSTR